MKFFDREYEIQKLREIRDLSHRAAQFTEKRRDGSPFRK